MINWYSTFIAQGYLSVGFAAETAHTFPFIVNGVTGRRYYIKSVDVVVGGGNTTVVVTVIFCLIDSSEESFITIEELHDIGCGHFYMDLDGGE